MDTSLRQRCRDEAAALLTRGMAALPRDLLLNFAAADYFEVCV
jgi:hypothetical protein